MKHNLLDGSGRQGVPKAERVTRLELMAMVLRDHAVPFKDCGDHLELTSDCWVPNVTPMTHLLRVATDTVFMPAPFWGRRWWSLKDGWLPFQAPKHVELKSHEVWLRGTRPVKNRRGKVLKDRVYIEPFELVSFPIIFFDEGSAVAQQTRRYLKLWHYPKEGV